MEKRESYLKIWQDLARDKGMLFLVGPRQAGKTTLAKIIAQSFTNQIYFNWDIPSHRRRLIENLSFFETLERRDASRPLVIFDEIHKYKNWKNYLKGVYDQFQDHYQFLVSGSGRLDIYQKGGDSLAGRYLLFHLWPFTLAEMGKAQIDFQEFLANPLEISMDRSLELKEIWEQLSNLSGFPEPFLSGRVNAYRRWSNTYSQQLIREDIRDMTELKSIKEVETLYLLLPSKVGSPLSLSSLAEDLHVSYNSVQNWLSVFERFFLVFSLSPYTSKIARAIQKEKKIYLWDTPRLKDPAARFENMVALELYRAITAWNDLGSGQFTLHFIKNKEKQEVDFLIANEGEPFLLIEAKFSDPEPSKALKIFQQALKIPAVQLINEGNGFRIFSNGNQSILVVPAYQWLSRLP
jgi:predicted AAA+ superfamily ATPase